MITLIIPTRNRAYALEQVLGTFFSQEGVSEIILIDDDGEDNTAEVFDRFSKSYPSVRAIYERNSTRQGASYGRQKGVELAQNEYILFCDDDEFLQPGYPKILLEKILSKKAEIVSGRYIFREVNEPLETAIRRFGKGLKKDRPVFDYKSFKLNNDAYMEQDTYLPFTNSIFMTTKTLLLQYGFDPFYRKGNGYREESDFQMNAFVNGHRALMTNDAYCIHMNMKEVRTGGQRINRLSRFYWTIHYNNYFYRKYFDKAKTKLNINYSTTTAIMIFGLLEFNNFFVRPFFVLSGRLWNRKGL